MKWSTLGIGLTLIAFACPLKAEKIIQCITNFPIDVAPYNRALKQHGYDGKVIVVDIKEYENALLVQKSAFHKFLRKLNLDYPKTADVALNVEKIVFFNIPPTVAQKWDLSRLPKEKIILFMWEPKTVFRKMYKPKLLSCFSKVYTWDDSLVDGKTFFKFHYPVFAPMIEKIPPFEEKKLCTLISSNLRSSVENELYSEREKVVRYFEDVHEEGFEFYGRKWDPSQFKSYRGAPSSDKKLLTMSGYRFAICYENTRGTAGYVTEKIFDCFAAGTIPIYWGASNIEQIIPKDCFIDRRDFDSMEELHLFMKSMRKEDYEGYISRIRAFLQSDDAKKFTFDHLAEDFYQAISN